MITYLYIFALHGDAERLALKNDESGYLFIKKRSSNF